MTKIREKMKKILTAKTMIELAHKVYRANSWKRAAGESRIARMKEAYVLEIDQTKGLFRATPKATT